MKKSYDIILQFAKLIDDNFILTYDDPDILNHVRNIMDINKKHLPIHRTNTVIYEKYIQ